MLNNKMENERAIAKIAMRNKCSSEGEVVGTSFFMVCENQSVAAEKYTALIAENQQAPEALLAPNPFEIVWKYMAKSNSSKFLMRTIFALILIVLFVAYLFGQTQLMGLLVKN